MDTELVLDRFSTWRQFYGWSVAEECYDSVYTTVYPVLSLITEYDELREALRDYLVAVSRHFDPERQRQLRDAVVSELGDVAWAVMAVMDALCFDENNFLPDLAGGQFRSRRTALQTRPVYLAEADATFRPWIRELTQSVLKSLRLTDANTQKGSEARGRYHHACAAVQALVQAIESLASSLGEEIWDVLNMQMRKMAKRKASGQFVPVT